MHFPVRVTHNKDLGSGFWVLSSGASLHRRKKMKRETSTMEFGACFVLVDLDKLFSFEALSLGINCVFS